MAETDLLARSRKHVFNSVFAADRMLYNTPTPLTTPVLGSSAADQAFTSVVQPKQPKVSLKLDQQSIVPRSVMEQC